MVRAEAKKRLSIKYASSIKVDCPRLWFVDFNVPFMITSIIKQLKSVATIEDILYFVLKYSMFWIYI